MDIDTAKRLYVELLPRLETTSKEMKELRKIERRCKTAFKKYLQSSGNNSVTVGGKTFSFEKKQKCVVSMDRMEDAFAPNLIQQYKEANTEEVEVLKCT
tara:strand:- start:26 stop:322 length:297 start_codon:yes stop_codon:yes gene_type:complete